MGKFRHLDFQDVLIYVCLVRVVQSCLLTRKERFVFDGNSTQELENNAGDCRMAHLS